MEIWQAIIFGVVQGFTEFLPVSSSGHLFILNEIFKLPSDKYMFFSVFMHVFTLIPVCVVFFKDILGLFKKPFNRFWYLVIATIPAGVVGVLYEIFGGDALFGGGYVYILASCFLITACVLFFAERCANKNQLNRPLTYKNTFIMGLAQAAGTMPGISRSGIVITTGNFLKIDKDETVKFAFLMSIPVIVASAAVEAFGVIQHGLGGVEVLPLLVGGIAAMVSGYIAIKFMLNVVRKARYKGFSCYLVLLSITLVILKATGVL